jgi:hypothetical protein
MCVVRHFRGVPVQPGLALLSGEMAGIKQKATSGDSGVFIAICMCQKRCLIKRNCKKCWATFWAIFFTNSFVHPGSRHRTRHVRDDEREAAVLQPGADTTKQVFSNFTYICKIFLQICVKFHNL